MKAITDQEGEELRRLYADYATASVLAAEALRTDAPDHILEGAALQRFLEADAKVSAIVGRIKEIQGTAGQPWNG